MLVFFIALALAEEEACRSVTCRWRSVKGNCPPEERTLRNIAVIYYAPSTLASGDVGLERAVDIWEAQSERCVTWLNTAALEGAVVAYDGEVCDVLQKFDHLLVKSNWDYVVDRFIRDYLWARDGRGCPVTRSLQIAGSYPPPGTPEAVHFYDLLFFETPWYGRTLSEHPRTVHAFGVDVDAMRRQCRKTATVDRYDWLFVGAFADHAGFKRPELLADRSGRRLAVGKLRDNTPNGPNVSDAARPVVDRLQKSGVDVRDPVPWADLASLFRSTRNVLVPDHTFGGGERLVLEARACDANVVTASDNPKLRDLVQGPLYTPLYYAGQLEHGILILERDLGSSSDTCGLASLSSPTLCRKSDAVLARVDLHS